MTKAHLRIGDGSVEVDLGPEGLRTEAGEHLAALAALLDGTYREVARRAGAGELSDPVGRRRPLALRRLELEPEPVSLCQLREAVEAVLPGSTCRRPCWRCSPGSAPARRSLRSPARPAEGPARNDRRAFGRAQLPSATPRLSRPRTLKYGRLHYQAATPLAQAWGGNLNRLRERHAVRRARAVGGPGAEPKYFGHRGGRPG